MISKCRNTTLRFLLAVSLILILLAATGCALLEEGNGKTRGLMPPKRTDKTNAPPDPMTIPE